MTLGGSESRFWTIPNALSLSRIALLPVWWWVMASPAISDIWGGVLIIYAIISDVADGYLARRLGQITRWGRILDPIGDKIAALVVGVFCVMHRGMSPLAFFLTIARDLALVIGGWLIFRKRYEIPTSINIGRYAALIWGLTLLCFAFDWQPVAGWLLWPAVAFYLLAGIVYLAGLRRSAPNPSVAANRTKSVGISS